MKSAALTPVIIGLPCLKKSKSRKNRYYSLISVLQFTITVLISQYLISENFCSLSVRLSSLVGSCSFTRHVITLGY